MLVKSKRHLHDVAADEFQHGVSAPCASSEKETGFRQNGLACQEWRSDLSP